MDRGKLVSLDPSLKRLIVVYPSRIHHDDPESPPIPIPADSGATRKGFMAKFEDGQPADVNFKLHAAPRESRREWKRYYCWTETGFLDADTFFQVVDQVATEWGVHSPSTNLLLFRDRLGAHMRPATLEKAF